MTSLSPFFTPQVAGSLGNAQTGLRQHLERLDEIFATRADYLQTLGFMRLMVNNVIRELTALPDITRANADLAGIADQTAFIEYYRWVEPPNPPARTVFQSVCKHPS